ncbi:MAG: beta-N-acetylglucosaminidase domain-containing protein [Arcanobacterium sp.]|nr:beta-N-acetylglucosaminidase domain-containing protein [Arcanobacterium sp.]
MTIIKQIKARVLACLCACALVVTALAVNPGAAAPASAAETEYAIYPTPHSVVYGDGAVSLTKADLVVEPGIDSETQTRLDEVLSLRAIPGITWKGEDPLPSSDGLSVLVGTKGSGGAVDQHVAQLVESGKLTYDASIFGKIDAYLLAVMPGVDGERDEIIVLGKDTDAAFYGLTSLYRIFEQASNASVRELTIADYADVRNRGFIEGYYGNPWSTQDRVELMRWGGYYKLNSYFYAPKDDPKHNAKWRELYTPEELASKIAPLAQAGNHGKTRFIYALHPFMNAPITSSNYDASVKILKEKFLQVIDSGVRQIAVLADDARDQGADLYTRLMTDMTAWIQGLQRLTNADGALKYPGLKDTIVFCPVNYYGNGESWYANLPATVQVINTGGAVWGKATHTFFQRFKNNSGRATFMWMNFPCSDNDKDALHMGNYENFLGLDVQPGDLEGLVMNPMQQSEPSKQAIFMNADFSWNLWDSLDHADRTWRDSFSYIDHNSPFPTDGSDALRTISEHLRRMFGGGVTWEARESTAVKDTLVALQNAIRAGNVNAEQVAAARQVYSDVQPAVDTFRAQGGTPAMVAQMKPWLDAFDDLIAAATYYFNAYDAFLAGNNDDLLSNYQAGNALLASYNNHAFDYMGHDEYAKVGKAYLTPTIQLLANDLKAKAAIAINPDAFLLRFITSRTDTPEGSISSILDGNEATGVTYKTPNTITTGTYVGIVDNKAFDADAVKFVLGAASGKNYFDHARLEYTTDGTAWQPVPDAPEATTSPVLYRGLNLTGIKGLRLYATADNARDAWLEVKEITINPQAAQPSMVPTVSLSANLARHSGELAQASDGDTSTILWLKPVIDPATPDYNTIKDMTPVDAAVTLTYPQAFDVKRVTFAQANNDQITQGVIEYSVDGTSNWTHLADVNGRQSVALTLDTPIHAKAIRVRNTERTAGWWKLAELSTRSAQDPEPATPVSATVTLSDGLGRYQGSNDAALTDGETTGGFVWTNASPRQGAFMSVRYSEPIQVGAIRFAQDTSDRITSGEIQVSPDGTSWETVAPVNGNALQTVMLPTPRAVQGIRVVNGADSSRWWKVYELSTVAADDLANRDALSAAIARASAKVEADYSVFTWQVLTGALNAARETYDNAAASQAAVDEATAMLESAINGLKPAGGGEPVEPKPEVPLEKPTDFSALNQSIASVNSLAQADYTAQTWADLAAALAAAQAVAGNPDATQEQVDAAWATLWTALKALDAAPEDPDEPEEPEHPDAPDTPDTPDVPVTPGESDVPATPGVPMPEQPSALEQPAAAQPQITQRATVADTGTHTAWTIAASLVLLALGGAFARSRSRVTLRK